MKNLCNRLVAGLNQARGAKHFQPLRSNFRRSKICRSGAWATSWATVRGIGNEKLAMARQHGTIAVGLRCRSMIKNIAYVALLTQIAVISVLIVQTLLSTPTQAANVPPVVKAAVVVADEECTKATWPNIPQHCLERVDARKQITMLGLAPAKE